MMEDKKIFWIRFVAVSVFVLSWIILIYINYSDENISLKTPLIITIVISVISAIAFFGNNLLKKIHTKKETMPEHLNEDKIREMVERQVYRMWNHLLIDKGIEEIRTKVINRNLICACKINLLYEEKFGNSCWMIINANYPDIIPSVMKPDTSDYLVEKAMNYKSLNPFDEPDTKETEESLDSFGKPVRKTKEITYKRKEEEKEDVV